MHPKRIAFLALLFLRSAAPLYAQAPRAEEFTTLTDDGAWCWFSDPRAVYHDLPDPRVYAGWTSARGDIVVGSYRYATGEVTQAVIRPEFEKDDHTNPSLLLLPDGRIMVFFSGHNGSLYVTTSNRAADVKNFGAPRRIDAGDKVCYSVPVMLSEENNRIYLFFRGGADWKPSFVTSDDTGKTWSLPRILVRKPGSSPSVRPYTKIISDGKSKIHFAFTDGHPNSEPSNSIYYMSYRQGTFFDAAGRRVGRLSDLPLDQNRIPRAYDGASAGARAWIWDLALTRDGTPVMVYATIPRESHHIYNYAAWNGTTWVNRQICPGGSWFPRFDKAKEIEEPEPYYSGGICLDHRDPTVVYLSRPHKDVFEIERWETSDTGRQWNHRPITKGSKYDNVRPVAMRGCPPGVSPSVLWMQASRYRHYTDYQACLRTDKPTAGFSAALKRSDILQVTTSAARWQMEASKTPTHHELDWTNGALYAGIFAWARMAKDDGGIAWLEEIGSRFGWQPYFRMHHADDICVSQTFLDLYRLTMDPRRLDPTRARADWICAHPSTASMLLDYSDPSTTDRWSWCDALFMAPPVYARLTAITGEGKYIEFMHGEYSATADLLYDREEHLFTRDHRFLPQREANGKRVFWGRGNGWVMGGLVSILKELPADHKYRKYYASLFTEMAAKVASVQDTAGFWHASLLDPASYPNPETSCTGFFCYALAYGINAGLLPRDKYLPHVRSAWKALVSSVSADGKLGWVQPIGEDPKKVDRQMTGVYGVGAFLLAGSEVWHLAE